MSRLSVQIFIANMAASPAFLSKTPAVTLLDVAPIVNLLTSGIYLLEADINCDGGVTLLDVAPFVEPLSGN